MAPTFLSALCRIAETAGSVVMEVYRSDFTHRRKADDSPVTEADLHADALIRRELSLAFPGVPVWSEESEEPASASLQEWRAFFLVDPLDGTKEFLQRNGEFTVNIAWIEAGRARAGVVHAPVPGLTWWGGPDLGAWRAASAGRADGGAPEPLVVQASPGSDKLRVLASRSHADGQLEGWLQQLGRPLEVVHAGSSLKFCRIAEGQADLYPRFGPTSQWDTAAGQAVLEGAGGCVTTLDGTALRYGRERPVINPSFVASRAPGLWQPTAPAASRRRS
jgi:3'(2'), 5'-bisphosphate nucleotidase